MKKILAHIGGSRQYRSILRHISILNNDSINFIANSLHSKLFDTCYTQKPDIILYPGVEYTQEIHNFIVQNNKKVQIILYIDRPVQPVDLFKFWSDTGCKILSYNRSGSIADNLLECETFYDDSIFTTLPNLTRNTKIAVSLSIDNNKNNALLENMLYPNQKEYNLVLFNNPEFKHPQNIGIYNEPDLNYILNTFGYFIDMDQEFVLEAAVCGIKNLDINHSNIIDALMNQQYIKQTLTDQNKCSHFVNNELIRYMGI